MSAAIKKSFAPPRDAEWAFTIAPLVNRWISSVRPETSSFEERAGTANRNYFSLQMESSTEMTTGKQLVDPVFSDIDEAFDTRLALFKRQLVKAKEIKHLDRRIKRVAAVRAQIKALVETYHAALA